MLVLPLNVYKLYCRVFSLGTYLLSFDSPNVNIQSWPAIGVFHRRTLPQAFIEMDSKASARQGNSYKEFLAARQARNPASTPTKQASARTAVGGSRTAATGATPISGSRRPSSLLKVSDNRNGSGPNSRSSSPLVQRNVNRTEETSESIHRDKGNDEYARLKQQQDQKLEDKRRQEQMLNLQKEQQEQDQRTLQRNADEINALNAKISALNGELSHKSDLLEKAKLELKLVSEEADKKVKEAIIEKENEIELRLSSQQTAPSDSAQSPPRQSIPVKKLLNEEGESSLSSLTPSSDVLFDTKLMNWLQRSGVVDPDTIKPRKTIIEIHSSGHTPMSSLKRAAPSATLQNKEEVDEDIPPAPPLDGSILFPFNAEEASQDQKMDSDSDSDSSTDSAFGQSGLNVDSMVKNHDDKFVNLADPTGPSLTGVENDSDASSTDSSEDEDEDGELSDEELEPIETFTEGMSIRNPTGTGENATVLASDLYVSIVHELLEFRVELISHN